jgi:uncharacterized RDD family membrane protein YckC
VAHDPQEPSPPADLVNLFEQDPGILGIDNVRLELPVAGIGSRLLAIALDQIAITIGATLWAVLCMAIGAAFGAEGAVAVVMLVITLVGVFLIHFGYFAICEIRMSGRTPGKSAVGLRTVSSLGGQASVAAIVVRNLVRLVDYLVGSVLVMVDRRHRRLGDLVAGTLVVHDPPAEDEMRLGRWPAGFTGREIALAEQLVRRIPRLEPERARLLASQFLAALSRRDPAFVAASPGAGQADPVFELWRIFGVATGAEGRG